MNLFRWVAHWGAVLPRLGNNGAKALAVRRDRAQRSCTDATQAHLEEFHALRQESLQHFSLASAVIGFEVTLLAGVIAFSGTLPIIFFLFTGTLSSFLWLSYMDHIASIHKIALYSVNVLRPKLSAALEEPVLEWETWLAEFNQSTIGRAHRERRVGLTYPSAMFGGLTLALMGAGAFFLFMSAGSMSRVQFIIHVFALMISLVALAYAHRQSKRLGVLIDSIKASARNAGS